jgi:hypothetical protein
MSLYGSIGPNWISGYRLVRFFAAVPVFLSVCRANRNRPISGILAWIGPAEEARRVGQAPPRVIY